MSQSKFSGGSGAQAGGSGFSNTTTSGSTNIQLKKLTLKTAAGKLVISPDEINFLITGEDGQFYDSKYKGDQISLPVTSVFDRTSVTGSSSLNIDKNGLAVPVFDLNFGPVNEPAGTLHSDYTRRIKIDTTGLTIPYTDVVLGILAIYSYFRTPDFIASDGVTLLCPTFGDLEPGLPTTDGVSQTFTLESANRPRFDTTTGGGDPHTILINSITLTVTGTTAQIDAITCYSEGSTLNTGDRITISNNELVNKLSLHSVFTPYFRPYIFSPSLTRFTQTSNTIIRGLEDFSSRAFATTTIPPNAGISGLTVKIRLYPAYVNDPTTIQEIIPFDIGTGYVPDIVVTVSVEELELDPLFTSASEPLVFTIVTDDFPVKATLSGNDLSLIIKQEQVTTPRSYNVRDFSMSTNGLSFPVDVPRFDDVINKRKELATIGSSGYFMPTKYKDANENTLEVLKITPNGIFGPGADSEESFVINDNANFFFNPNSGLCKFYNITANEITGTIKNPTQNYITSMPGLLTFGADSVNTTCSGTLIAEQGLKGEISSLSSEQPNITTLAGANSLGTSGQTIVSLGNLTVQEILTVNGELILGPLATLKADSISGVLTGTESANQPNILTLEGLTSVGIVDTNVDFQGGLTTANNITASTGTITGSKINATTSLSGVLTAFDANDTSTAVQPNITTLTGVTSIGTLDATTTCAGSFIVTQNFTTNDISATNLTGFVKTTDQEYIEKLDGVTSIGKATVETLFKGNNFNADSGSITAANGIYGTIKDSAQPDITTLTGITTLSSSGTTVDAQGNWTIAGTLTADNGGQIGSTTPLSLLNATSITGTIDTAQQDSITKIGNSITVNADKSVNIDGPLFVNGVATSSGVSSVGTTTSDQGWFNLYSTTNHTSVGTGGIILGDPAGGENIYIKYSSNNWILSHSIVMANNSSIKLGADPRTGLEGTMDAATRQYVDTATNQSTLETTLGSYFVKYTSATTTLNMGNNKIVDLALPQSDDDAISRRYLDQRIGAEFTPFYLEKTGGTLTGNLVMDTNATIRGVGATATHDDEAVSKKLLDDSLNNFIKKDGTISFTSSLNMGSNRIENVGAPISNNHVVTKSFLETDTLGTNNSYYGYVKRDGSSGQMEGNFNFGNNNITNLKDPVNLQDAATKKHVADQVSPIQTTVNSLGTTYIKIDGTNLISNFNMQNRKIINLTAPTEDAHAANKLYVDEAIAGGTSGIDDTTRRINGLTGRLTYKEFNDKEDAIKLNNQLNTIRGELAKLRYINDNEERIDNIENNFSTSINSIQGKINLNLVDHNNRITVIEEGDHKRLNSLRGDIINTTKKIEESITLTNTQINTLRGDILQQITDIDRINSVEGKMQIISLTVSDSEQSIKTLENSIDSNLTLINSNNTSNIGLINSNLEKINILEKHHNYKINEILGKTINLDNRIDLLEFLTEKRMNTFEGKLLSISNVDDIHLRINTVEGKILQINKHDTLESRLNTLEGKLMNNNTSNTSGTNTDTERLNSIEGLLKSINKFDPDDFYLRINTLEGALVNKTTSDTENTDAQDKTQTRIINTLRGELSVKIRELQDFSYTRINTVEGSFNIKLSDHQNILDKLDTKFDHRINTIEGKFLHFDNNDLIPRINSIEGHLAQLGPTDNNDIIIRLNTIEGKLLYIDNNDSNFLSLQGFAKNLENNINFIDSAINTRINTIEGKLLHIDNDAITTILSLQGFAKNLENNINFIDCTLNTRFNTLEGKLNTQNNFTELNFNTLEGSISTESNRAQTEEENINSRINSLEGALVNKTTTDTENTEVQDKIQNRITNTIRGELTGKIRELQEENNETNTRISTLEGALATKETGGGAPEEHSHDSGTTLSGTDSFTSGNPNSDINMSISAGMEMSTAISTIDFWLFTYLFDKPPAVTSVTATSYPTYVDVQWTNPAQLQAAFMAVKLPHIVNIIVQIQIQNQNTWTNIIDSPISNQTNRAQLYLTSSSVSESSGATYVKKVLQTGTNYNLRIYADNLSDRGLNYYSHGTLIATLSIGIPSLIRNLNLSSASSSSITIIFTNPQRFNTNLGDASSQNNEPNLDDFVITWTPTGLQTPSNRYNAQDNYSTTGSYTLNASNQTQNGTHNRNLSNSLPPNYKFDVSVKVKNVENTTGGTNNDGYSDTVTSSFNTSDLAYSVNTLGNITISGNQYTGRSLNNTSHSNIFSFKPTGINNIGYFRINNTIGTQSVGISSIKSYIGTATPGASDWVALGNFDGFPVKGYSAFSNANISATPSVSDQETDQYKTGYWLKANLSSLNFDGGLTINENTTYTVGIQQTIGVNSISKTDTFIYETGVQRPVAGNMYTYEITGATIFRYVSGIPMISSGTTWGFSVNMQYAARFFFPQNRRLFLIKIQNSGSNVGSSIYLYSNTSTFYEIDDITEDKSTTTYSVPNDGSPFREFVQFQSTITFSPSNALYEDLSVYGLPYSIWNTYNGGSNTASTGKYGTSDLSMRSDQKSYNIIDNWNTSSKGTWYKITADPHSLSGLSSSGSVATYDHENCGFFRNDDRNLHMYNGELRFPATNDYTGYHLPSYNWGAWANTNFNYTSVTGGRTAMYTALNNNSSSAGTYRYVLFRYQNVLNNADRTDNLNIVIHGISDSSGSSNVTSPKTSGVTPFNIVNNFELFIKLDGSISGGKVGGTAAESGWWDVNHGAMNLAYQFGNITNHIGTGNGGGVCQSASYSSGNLNYEAKFPADTVADVWVLVGTTNTVAFDYISIS